MKNIKLNKMIAKTKKIAYLTGFKIKKHQPEIMVIGGIVGGVTSAVLACKATTKLQTVLDESAEEIKKVDAYTELHGFTEKYNEQDYKNDIRLLKAQRIGKVIRLYLPSALLGAASVGSILYGHNILSKRNAAISAAYAAVDKSFKEYRQRVVEQYGEDVDRQLRFNTIKKTVTEVDENGNKVERDVEEIDPGSYSEFAKFFDAGSKYWCKSAESNLSFLKTQQIWANKKLRDKGFLLLNDVYDLLDIAPTKAGMVVGWIYDEKNPVGDNCIDFGIFESDWSHRRFINGLEPNVLLDFNVDGNIYDLMK